jgi:hypothetical protein
VQRLLPDAGAPRCGMLHGASSWPPRSAGVSRRRRRAPSARGEGSRADRSRPDSDARTCCTHRCRCVVVPDIWSRGGLGDNAGAASARSTSVGSPGAEWSAQSRAHNPPLPPRFNVRRRRAVRARRQSSPRDTSMCPLSRRDRAPPDDQPRSSADADCGHRVAVTSTTDRGVRLTRSEHRPHRTARRAAGRCATASCAPA